ncbi:redoxin domain-containing protein [bacterium AH-315-F18]|nr:redoxin domain-containing protein [bacterium AH-315-F18]
MPACEADLPKFGDKDTVVFGISIDSVPTNVAYAKSMNLDKVQLLSDFHPKGEVAKKYGVYLEDKGITARASILVGKDGKVKWVKVNDLGDQRDNGEILGAI